MFERNLAKKMEGWNTISDISEKLKVKKSTAYVYAHKLDEKGFVRRKIKKPRGTMYLIDPIQNLSDHKGIMEDADIVTDEIQFSNHEIPPEHKIAYFLKKVKEGNPRYKDEARKLLRSIKNWKKLYRYLKAYEVIDEFRDFYLRSRREVSKVPSMPKRYENLIGV